MRIAPAGAKNGLNEESKITTKSELNKAEKKLKKYIEKLQTEIDDNKNIGIKYLQNL